MAANWQWIGRTNGCGKKRTTHAQALPAKDIWLYPLHCNFLRHWRR